MRHRFTVLFIVFIAHANLFAAVGINRISVTLDDYDIRLENEFVVVSISDGFSTSAVGEPDLPWMHFFVSDSRFPESAPPYMMVLRADTIRLVAPLAPTFPPVQTRDVDAYPAKPSARQANYPHQVYPTANSRIESSTIWRGQSVVSVSWCPFRYYPDRNLLIVIREGLFCFPANEECAGPPNISSADTRISGYDDLRQILQTATPLPGPATIDNAARAIRTGTPTDVDYLIITDETLASAFHPLAQWRLQQGYRAGIALVDEIVSAYPGEDTPARIRAYLADAHDGGLQFCVLGGDETVVPIRYAYHSYSNTMPDYDRLQICDLYYADVNSDWDTDGDGIYGEYLQDGADLFPEIYLGRLLAANAGQAEAIVEKIIDYESNPGGGDRSYLTRALFTCADQMRDWDAGDGQHTAVAKNFPDNFDLDLDSQSENPYGSLPDPQVPEGADFIDFAGAGWGWMTFINHGRTDGFILRAAGINQHPKSYVWASGSGNDGHGYLNSLPEDHRPGIVLSVACDAGGFDMDGPLFGGGWGKNTSEVFLQKPAGGAVAMIAYSRWGWVASSYRIIGKIAEYAFDPAIAPQLGVAFALAKANFPYYRDQNLGLNLYGDPAMPHWTALPNTMQANFPAQVTVNSGAVQFTVNDGYRALAGALVTATYNDTVFLVGETDQNGMVTWCNGPERIGGYQITVSKPGYLPVIGQLIAPIATDIIEDDGAGLLPLALLQNFPNPFNPTTTIEFVLLVAEPARLKVFDILGRRVATRVVEILPAGNHEVVLAATDDPAMPLASGLYCYRCQAGTKAKFRKMGILT